jgi:hypothetical protein
MCTIIVNDILSKAHTRIWKNKQRMNLNLPQGKTIFLGDKEMPINDPF